MVIHTVKIPYKYGETVTLKPLADVHWGNKYCDKRAVKSYVAEGYEDPNCYLIGIGDWLDAIITKDVKRYMKHSDGTESDSVIDEQIDTFIDIVRPYAEAGRLIGIGTGNHESAINKYHGTHPIRRMCKELGVKSLGFSWLVRLNLREETGRGRSVVIRGHHGWGGGSRTQGADLTKYSKDITYWDADIFLYGHVHKRQSDKIDRLGLVGDHLIAKPKHVIICGTFLKTLSDTDEATYSEEKGYPPVAIGGVDIRIKPDHEWVTIKCED